MFLPLNTQQLETRLYKDSTIIEGILTEKHLQHLWKNIAFVFFWIRN